MMIKVKKGMVLTALIFMLVLLVSGCGSTAVNEGTGTSDASEVSETSQTSQTEKTHLNIGVMSDVGAVPFVLAGQEGYFEDENLEVEITVFKSATDRDAAFQTGNLDGIMADMMTIVFYEDAGLGAKVTSETAGNYRMVSQPGLEKEALLASDSISVGLSTNTVIDFVTEQAAAALGFEERLDKVAIPQMPTRLEMLRKGELSAATLPEPLASAALIDGGTVVTDTQEMGLYPGIFIFSGDSLENNGDAVRAFYRAYNRGVDYVNATDIDTYFQTLVDVIGFPPTLEGQFDMPTLVHAEPADEVTFNAVMTFMTDKALTTSAYKLSDVSTDAFLPEE
jgi:NitT/TauT family transport system substrate-binding protein